MRIIGYIILGIYHAGIVIPMFFIIPESIIIALYLFYEKKFDKKYIRHFFKISFLAFLTTTLISHFYFKTRGIVNAIENIPILYNPIVFILMLLFAIIPFLPIPIAYYLNKKLYKKKERKLFYFASAYFIFALILIFFFIRNASSAHIKSEFITQPLLLPNLVNFTEIFDIFESEVFHQLFHIIF